MPNHVFITGGAQGLGKALAQLYLREGSRVTILDCEEPTWPGPAGSAPDAGARWIDLDLGDSPISPAFLDGLPPVDLLICNAGVSAFGRFTGLSCAEQWRVLEVNCRGHLELLHALLSRELIAPGGRIAFILSAAVFTPVPVTAAYAASKSALDGLARSLEPWLLHWNIGVTRIYPGQMNTEHLRRFYPSSKTRTAISPEQVARRVARGLERRKRVLYPDAMSRIFALLSRIAAPWLPRLLLAFNRRQFGATLFPPDP